MNNRDDKDMDVYGSHHLFWYLALYVYTNT